VKRFEKKIKNLTVEIISNCGHSAHEEAPDIVNGFILEFLQGK
jgi:pimeloyl-ACP methyl ester carboxylesterase